MKTELKSSLLALMRKSLDNRYNSYLRYCSFKKMYDLYIQKTGSDKNWINDYNDIRSEVSNELSDKQRNKYGLDERHLKTNYLKLYKWGSKYENNFPLLRFSLGNNDVYSLIKMLVKKGDKIFEVGYGDKPILVELFNEEGYSCVGIDSCAKVFDKIFSFKYKLHNLPKFLYDKYDIVYATLVLSINHMYFFKNKYKWMRKNRKKILNILASLVKTNGYLILKDDIGSMFKKCELERFFRILFFEKDIPMYEFGKKKKFHGHFKLSLFKRI